MGPPAARPYERSGTGPPDSSQRRERLPVGDLSVLDGLPDTPSWRPRAPEERTLRLPRVRRTSPGEASRLVNVWDRPPAYYGLKGGDTIHTTGMIPQPSSTRLTQVVGCAHPWPKRSLKSVS